MKARKLPRVNLTRIAKESGVNLSTVSRILRNEEGYTFAEDTRRKVLGIAEKYRYRSNLLVRGLVTGRTLTVGVVIPADGFHAQIIKGVHDRLGEAGMGMMLAWNEHHLGPEALGKEKELLARLVERRVDGIILRPVNDEAREAYFREILDRDLPLVTVDRRLAGMDVDFSGSEDEEGGRLAAEHLAGLGHRHVFLANFSSSTSPARDRRRGFEKRAAALGMEVAVVEDPGDENWGNVLETLFRKPAGPTGGLCTTTTIVRAAYRAAAKSGRPIPQTLSIIGFTEEESAEFMTPPLTTVRQDALLIGRNAAELLLTRLDGSEKGGVRLRRAPVELVARGSTSRARRKEGRS